MKRIKAVFLDRDGVINEDFGYVSNPLDFKFCNGVFTALRGFLAMDYCLFIVTNQSGIARGYYSRNDFWIVSEFMLSKLKEEGIEIKKIYYCPHSPEQNCNCRKPNAGMILNAKKEFNIELSSSIMVGDKLSDIEAGKNAGVGQNFLIGDRFKSLLDVYEYVRKNL